MNFDIKEIFQYMHELGKETQRLEYRADDMYMQMNKARAELVPITTENKVIAKELEECRAELFKAHETIVTIFSALMLAVSGPDAAKSATLPMAMDRERMAELVRNIAQAGCIVDLQDKIDSLVAGTSAVTKEQTALESVRDELAKQLEEAQTQRDASMCQAAESDRDCESFKEGYKLMRVWQNHITLAAQGQNLPAWLPPNFSPAEKELLVELDEAAGLRLPGHVENSTPILSDEVIGDD